MEWLILTFFLVLLLVVIGHQTKIDMFSLRLFKLSSRVERLERRFKEQQS